VDHWQTAVLCTVLGSNPPLGIMDRYIRKTWAQYGIDTICMVKKGLFIVRFNKLEDQLEVINKGVYYFAQKPLVVKPWNPEMEINTEEINSLPIWVQLPGLDLKYWGNVSLSKIGSYLGIPLKTDKYTRDKSMLQYARILIDIPLEGSFPEYVDFANDKGVLVRPKVVYEWKPVKCKYCHMFGHEMEICRNKRPIRQEWRVVQPEAVTAKSTQPLSNPDNEGFQSATAGKMSKQITASNSPQATPITNQFEILQEPAEAPINSSKAQLNSHG